MKVYWNGTIVDSGDVSIAPDDHGFLYGAGLFETFRTHAGVPFLLDRHMDRLLRGCARLEIRLPGSSPAMASGPDGRYSALRTILERLLAANAMPDAVFRYTASAGPGAMSHPYTRPVELIVPRPLPEKDVRPGITLHLLETVQPGIAGRMKATAFLNNVLALRELARRTMAPGDEGIVTDESGAWVEGAVSNLWFIVDDRLQTASPAGGVLEGVTRGWVLEEASRRNISVMLESLQPDSAKGAAGIFCTNAVRGLAPVASVCSAGGETLWAGDTANHPIFKVLSAAHRQACAEGA